MQEIILTAPVSSISSEHTNERQRLDLALLAFIQRFANSPVRYDIVAYFALHMDARSTVQEIARWTGYRPPMIEAELEDLTLLGLLRAEGTGKERTYTVTWTPHLRRAMQRFRDYLLKEPPTSTSPLH